MNCQNVNMMNSLQDHRERLCGCVRKNKTLIINREGRESIKTFKKLIALISRNVNVKHSPQHEGKSALKNISDARLSKALGAHPEAESLLWAVVLLLLLLFTGT